MRRISPLYTLILALPLFSTLYAQPDTLWTKSIGGDLTDVFYSIEPMTGGGYIAGGYTESNPDTLRKYWLARLNSAGDDTVWTRADTAGGTEGRMAIATSDGGAIIVGTGNPRIIKTDGDGALLWQKDESTIAGGLFWIDETADNGLIACGVYQPGGVGSAYIVRMNSTGTVLWDTTYGSTNDSYGLSITELANGEFAMAGAFRSKPESTAEDAWVLKLSANGDSLGSVFYGDTAAVNRERFRTVRTTSDGGLILLGEQTLEGQTEDIMLVKADANGDSSWVEIIGVDDALSGQDVIQTSDGGFAVIAYGDLTSQGGFDMILIHTDGTGTTDWTKQISPPYGAAGTGLTEISADEYLAVGVVFPDAGAPMDAWVVRLGAATGGETVTWDGGGGDNNWTTAANWSGDAVPGTSDSVVIDLDGATVLLPNATAITVGSLTLGGDDGGTVTTLKSASPTTATGFRLHVNSGVAVASDGHLFMQGSSQGTGKVGDSLVVAGTITNNGTVTFRNSSYISSAGLTNNNLIISDDGNDLWGANEIAGNVTNNAAGTIEIVGESPTLLDGNILVTGNLTNYGIVSLYTSGTQYYPQAELNVAGVFTIMPGGTFRDSSDTYYNGYRTLTADSLVNQGQFLCHAKTEYNKFGIGAYSGSIGVVNSGTLHITSGTGISNLNSFTNEGTIVIDSTSYGGSPSTSLALHGVTGGGSFTSETGSLSGNGILEVYQLTLDITRPFEADLDSLQLTLAGGTTANFADSLIIHRSVEVADGSSITANGLRNQGILKLNGGSITASVINNDSLNVGNNSVITGDITNGSSGKLIVAMAGTNAGLSVDGNLTNHGYLELNPVPSSSYTTLLSITNGALNNAIAGTIQGAPGYTGHYSFIVMADLVNEGLFESNFRINIYGGNHSNGGTFQINRGAAGTYQTTHSIFSFQSDATFTNTGTVSLDTSSSLYIYGSTYQGGDGTLEGVGSLVVTSAGHAYLGQKFIKQDEGVQLGLYSGSIYVDTLVNRSAWTVQNANVYADSAILNEGELTFQGTNSWHGRLVNLDTLIVEPSTSASGNTTLGGPVVNEAGGLLSIRSNASRTTTATVDSSLTNNGTLELLNIDGATAGAFLDVNKGWFTNAGTFNDLVYATLTADLDNQGTFNVAPTTTFELDKNPQLILNSGTIHVTGGDYFKVTYLDSLVITTGGVLMIDAGCTAKFYGPYVSGNFPVPDADFMVNGGEVYLGGMIEGKYLSIFPGSTLYFGDGEKADFTNCRIVADSLINYGYITMSNTSVLAEAANFDTLIVRTIGAKFDSTLVNQAEGIIRAEGSYGSSWTYLDVDSMFTNHGELVLTTTTTSSRGIILNVGAGNLLNSATGAITAAVGVSTSTALEHQLNGDVANQGLFKVDSAAVLTIAGTWFNNEPGGIVQGGGTLDVSSVAFSNAGAVNPGGSPGILTFDGNFAQDSTGVINLELAGDDPGTGYDQLVVSGELALAGSLKVSIIDPYNPAEGKTFLPLVYGSASGMFESLTTEGGGGKFLSARITDAGVFVSASIAGGNNWPFMFPLDDITAAEDTSLSILLSAFDPDTADVLVYTASADTPAVILEVIEDTLNITLELDWFGIANIQVIVTDQAGYGLADTTSFVLTIEERPELQVDIAELVPDVYALHSNYPNPFNPSTTIRYDLPEAADISLVVYDMLGREVARLADGYMAAGYHRILWNGRTADGRQVPSGIYIARMVTTGYTKSMKMLLLK